MFNNIGGKIKTVAATVAWIGIILSCLGGFILIVQGLDYDEELILYGLLAAGLGSLFSWLGSLTLYGLGQLIENSDELVRQGQHRQGSTPNYGAPTNNYGAPTNNYGVPNHPYQ